ncbi:hypothetical protein IMZ48_09565 [Candidatus Bathyarchaeota archaeon]|nr:hypothetical protein [Candidatus Bathyarchaeota archaeon]
MEDDPNFKQQIIARYMESGEGGRAEAVTAQADRANAEAAHAPRKV